jgi:hypothetical protein
MCVAPLGEPGIKALLAEHRVAGGGTLFASRARAFPEVTMIGREIPGRGKELVGIVVAGRWIDSSGPPEPAGIWSRATQVALLGRGWVKTTSRRGLDDH